MQYKIFSKGAVVRIPDEWNNEDRSYAIVVSVVEGTDRVDNIPAVWDYPLLPPGNSAHAHTEGNRPL